MKKFILGFVVAAVLLGGGFFAYRFFGGSGPVSPEMLKPDVTDYGTLKVTVLGQGRAPLPDVEVDLGTIGKRGPEGPMAFARTNSEGVALFERVPVGGYDVFWNSYFFPEEYSQPSRALVEITKDKTTEKVFELSPARQ